MMWPIYLPSLNQNMEDSSLLYWENFDFLVGVSPKSIQMATEPSSIDILQKQVQLYSLRSIMCKYDK